MSAQAQQFFPLSALFQMLNLDGKDKVLPVIRENEHYQEQMQALQQQVEQMGQQLEQAQAENQDLQKKVSNTMDAMAEMSARNGGQQIPIGDEMPGQAEGESAIVGQAENNFGQQTGQPLPT